VRRLAHDQRNSPRKSVKLAMTWHYTRTRNSPFPLNNINHFRPASRPQLLKISFTLAASGKIASKFKNRCCTCSGSVLTAVFRISDVV
jgi:hypothetical protein